MPYSIKGSRTRIYPGTILFHLAINAKLRYNLMTYRYPPDTSLYYINAKPMGAILSLCFSTHSLARINNKRMGPILSAIGQHWL